MNAEPTLALLEISSLAQGYAVADQMVKAAAVKLLRIEPVSPGKLLILHSGGVAEVEIAQAAGLSRAGADLIDQLLLPQAHPELLPAWDAPVGGPVESLGLLECATAAAGLLSADGALKTADVRLLTLRVARGIGGKTLALFAGELFDVEAALEAGARLAEARGALLRRVVIARAHDDLVRQLAGSAGGAA